MSVTRSRRNNKVVKKMSLCEICARKEVCNNISNNMEDCVDYECENACLHDGRAS